MTEANSLNAATTGIVGNTGTAFTGTAVTQYNVIVGGATSSTLANVAPSATSGVPVISQGAAANPAFGTAVVAGGGTGATSFTTNGAVISNTTGTGALAAVALANQKILVGNTSAAPTAKSFTVVRQVFTSTGTYTPTSGMVYCDIEVLGGGGGGGGAASGATGVAAGAGGGSGGYAKKIVSAATIGASQSVTIGAAGAAGSAGNNAGGTGGTTSVGSIVSATGGVGGAGGPNNAITAVTFSAGGAGGVGSSGDLNANGGQAQDGTAFLHAATIGYVLSGQGADGIYGGGGVASAFAATGANAGGAATVYGGGGGGGGVFQNASAAAGGAGAAGVVIVTEYVLA